MASAPSGPEDLAVIAAKPAEVNLSTRSLLRGRLLHLDDVPVVELEDEGRAVTVSAEGDRASAADQLEQIAATLLAAAHELRLGLPGHQQVMIPLNDGRLVPWCQCGQSHGVLS
jgi:hypothetical protein